MLDIPHHDELSDTYGELRDFYCDMRTRLQKALERCNEMLSDPEYIACGQQTAVEYIQEALLESTLNDDDECCEGVDTEHTPDCPNYSPG